jgi:hypothetical protein
MIYKKLLLTFLFLLFAVICFGSIPIQFIVEPGLDSSAEQQCREALANSGPEIYQELMPGQLQMQTVQCYLVTAETFQRELGRTLPDWGVGVAFPDGKTIVIDCQTAPDVRRGLDEIFLHELVHILLIQGSLETRLPHWFHEGLAQKLSGEWRVKDTLSVILSGRVPSLYSLDKPFPANSMLADKAYRASLLAINFLEQEYGREIYGQLIAETAFTGDFRKAFYNLTNDSLDEFAFRFRNKMQIKYGWLVIITRWPTMFVIMAVVFAIGAIRKIILRKRMLAAMEDYEDDEYQEFD